MNARQAAKAAAAKIVEMEYAIRRYRTDVKAYNECIDAMIQGKSPCDWCEEKNECQLEAKGGKGCEEWWLMDVAPEEEEENDSEGIYGQGSSGGART